MCGLAAEYYKAGGLESFRVLDVLPDPIQDSSKPELLPGKGSLDEFISLLGVYIQVKSVSSQKNVGCRESNSLISIEKTMVHAE